MRELEDFNNTVKKLNNYVTLNNFDAFDVLQVMKDLRRLQNDIENNLMTRLFPNSDKEGK